MLNKIQDAIRQFDKAIKIKNDFSSAYFNKGMAYNALRGKANVKKAVELLNMAIQYQDDFYEAHYNKGCILMNLGDYTEALKSFKKCLELEGDKIDEECENKIKECNIHINMSLDKEKGGEKQNNIQEENEGEEKEES